MPSSLSGVAAAVITLSDRCARGEREDTSGPVLADALRALGAAVDVRVIPDGAQSVEAAIRSAISAGCVVILTTGGTGLSSRDQTPEGTAQVLELDLPGISELLRAADGVACE